MSVSFLRSKFSLKASVFAFFVLFLFCLKTILVLFRNLGKRFKHFLFNQTSLYLLVRLFQKTEIVWNLIANIHFFIKTQIQNLGIRLSRESISNETFQAVKLFHVNNLGLQEQEVINSKLSDYFCFFKYRNLLFVNW
ncbi:DUF5426 family protein [Mycoplasmoides genitalium]